MKKIYITITFIAFLANPWNAFGQSTCIGTVLVNSLPVCVTHILSLEKAVLDSDLRNTYPDRGDILLFYKYFHASTLLEHRNLFLANDWYDLNEKDFRTWKIFLQSHPIYVEGIVRYVSHGRDYASIQYYVVIDGMYDRATFLAKKIGNSWHPTSSEEDGLFAHEIGFFRTIRPQFLEYLIDEKASPTSMRSNSRAAELKNKLGRGAAINTAILTEDQLKIGSFRSPDYQTLYYNLQEMVNPETWYSADRANDLAFTTYMDSLTVPVEKQTEVMALIGNFQYLKAAIRIAHFQGSELWVPVHIQAIRRIYGENRIVTFEASPANE
jgi:hypothetical protein